MDGWIKLHRQSLRSSVFENPNIWFIWCWCLMKASHEPFKFPFNGNDLELKTGQFITGRNKALKELPMITAQNWRTAIEYLKSTNRITIQVTNKFSLITVINWHKYQDTNQQSNQQSNQPVTNQSPTSNHIQELKNDKNNKKRENTKVAFAPPSLEEVKQLIQENGYNVDPDQWFSFYESKGWLVGKNKMKDWKAAVRTWAIRNKDLPVVKAIDPIEQEAKELFKKMGEQAVFPFGKKYGDDALYKYKHCFPGAF